VRINRPEFRIATIIKISRRAGVGKQRAGGGERGERGGEHGASASPPPFPVVCLVMYEHVQKHKEKHVFPPSVLLRMNDRHRFPRGADAAGNCF
jgi:hypothetical protein